METEKPFIHPYLALLIGVIAVSTSAIFVKLISAPAPITATYRMLFTVLFMTPFVLRTVRYEVATIGRLEWMLSGVSGLFLAAHFILWFESLQLTSVASSVVLVCLQPLFAFIGGYIFFKERLGILAIIGGLLAFAGSVVIGWGDFQVGGLALIGDLLALTAAVAVTIYWMMGQHLRKTLSFATYSYLVYGFATIGLVIYDLLLNYPLYPYPLDDWFWFFCLALFPTMLGHSVFNWVIRWVNASTISMSILGEPIGASILAYFILHESISLEQWIGGSIILLGIYLFMKNRT